MGSNPTGSTFRATDSNFQKFTFIENPNVARQQKGSMAEWSKAIDSSSIIFGCAGSNPADTILKQNVVSNPHKAS